MKGIINGIILATLVAVAVIPIARAKGVSFHDFMFWAGCAGIVLAALTVLGIAVAGQLIKPQDQYQSLSGE